MARFLTRFTAKNVTSSFGASVQTLHALRVILMEAGLISAFRRFFFFFFFANLSSLDSVFKSKHLKPYSLFVCLLFTGLLEQILFIVIVTCNGCLTG